MEETASPPRSPMMPAPMAGPMKLMLPCATLSQAPMAVARTLLVSELPQTTLQQSPDSAKPSQ